MDNLQTRSGVGPTHAFIFAVSIVVMLFGWRWADQVAEQSAQRGYWAGIAATALPALAAWWSSLAMRTRRGTAPPSGAEQAFDVLRWLALLFLLVWALVPLF
jgi:hypothetical protein